MTGDIPKHAQVVIIGGGVVGCSVAYHLIKAGMTDIVLLERKRLCCGTTWHAAGLITQLRATRNLTELSTYGLGLFRDLERETGQEIGLKQNGSILLAADQEHWEEIRRGASMARGFGLEVELMTPTEAGKMYPLLTTSDLVGAVYMPRDGQVNPTDVTQTLAKSARAGGAKILENSKVTGIQTHHGQVAAVVTESGEIQCEYVVNCAGMWARELGLIVGVDVPLYSAEHYYVVTEPLAEVTPELPILRDPGGYCYFKEDAGKLLVGSFEPRARPLSMGAIPEDFAFDQLPGNWDHFEPMLESAMHRVPRLETAGIQLFFCGPESFTPDNRYHLGEAPDLKNFFVAAGFNSMGVQASGGAGKVIAEWIRDGHPPMDIWEVDIRRNKPFQNNRRYLHDRTVETVGLLYAMHWPYRQVETCRNVRVSPLHQRLAAAGACFGESSGWEVANWFAPEGMEAKYLYSYGRQNWFDESAREHRTVREAVGLIDYSSFSIFLLQGADAARVLDRICANDVDVCPERVVYTQWLNDRGGIESDLTVTRVAEDVYWIVTSASQQVRDFHWLKGHIADDKRAILTDVTSGYAVLGVMGPKSRDLLSAVSDTDFSNDAFPFCTCREIEIGYVHARALRISYVGELGWELYVPADMAVHVYDTLIACGTNFELRNVGLHAVNSLRIEKAYKQWGLDLADEDTPLEAGLDFALAWHKPNGFIGRDALLRQRDKGVKKRLVQFYLKDPAKFLYRSEPILWDDRSVGHVTSGAFGHTLGHAIGLGWVQCPEGSAMMDDVLAEGNFEIEVACERVPAKGSTRPLYDPRSERVKM